MKVSMRYADNIIASKTIGKDCLILLLFYEGFYLITAPNYCSGNLPSEWSLLDAMECFNQTDMPFLNSVGEY